MTDLEPKRGRPTVFSVEMAERAYSAAQQGATDAEIAEFLEIGTTTFYRWCHEHPEFREATRLGKEAADDRVERSLYQRAIGYSHGAVKIFMPAGAEAPVYAPYTEHFPPDTQAASLWLRNRRPTEWRDKIAVESDTPPASITNIMNVLQVVTTPEEAAKAYQRVLNGDS
jgi:hypothetical protein